MNRNMGVDPERRNRRHAGASDDAQVEDEPQLGSELGREVAVGINAPVFGLLESG